MSRVKRELFVLFVNTGTSTTPVWKALGRGVTSSAFSVSASPETETDILGITETTIEALETSQPFDAQPIMSDDPFIKDIIDAIMMKRPDKLMSKDVLVALGWNETSTPPYDAYRYDLTTFEPTELGGDGGGFNTISFTVHPGGATIKGSVNTVNHLTETVIFTPAT